MWAYFRSLDGFYRRCDQFRSTPHDPEGQDRASDKLAPQTSLHLHPDSRTRTSRSLCAGRTRSTLRDRIQALHSDSLLAVLVNRANMADLDADRPWELSRLSEVSPILREHLHNAELFAVCMQGAALLYNLMLSELQGHKGRVETYRGELEAWAADVDAAGSDLADWKLDGVWSVVRARGRSVGFPTRTFVERWIANLKQGGSEAVTRGNSQARALVRDREIQLKRGRARLASQRHLELWGGQSGTGRLNYRWGDSPMTGNRMILRDIFDGLERSEADAGDA